MAQKTRRRRSEDASTPDDDWLEGLEEVVHQAARTIRDLRGEREKLSAENRKLRQELDKAESAEAKSGDSEVAAWNEERREIRDRVERLTARLEELLGDA